MGEDELWISYGTANTREIKKLMRKITRTKLQLG